MRGYGLSMLNSIGTCMRVNTATPFFRPGRNFHLLTASTAGSSKARFVDQDAVALRTDPSGATMKSTVTCPFVGFWIIECG